MRKRISFFSFPVFILLFASASFAASSSKGIKNADSAISKEPSVKSIQEAMKEFNSLSKRDKKKKIKEIKKAIKQYKAEKKEGDEVSTNTLLLVIIAILIPPLAVYIHEGETNNKFWISVLLTFLGLLVFGFGGIFFLGTIPAIIYALYVILSGGYSILLSGTQ